MGRVGKKLVRLGKANGPRSLFGDLGDDYEPATNHELPSSFDSKDAEESYARIVPFDHRRKLGQFFTPTPIAELLCRWVAETGPRDFLDPAAGTGVLAREFHRLSPTGRITALDVDPLAISALHRTADASWKSGIHGQDFLNWPSDAEFDAIVANPPYLRHHDINYSATTWSRIERASGIKLSRLTNAYVLFILEICRRLRIGGRAGIIVPGEWLNANFGTPLKEFLLHGQWLRQLVYFSHAELLFPDALTTACLLFIERPRARTSDYSLRTLFVPADTAILELQNAVLHELAPRNGVVERKFNPSSLLEHSKWNSVLESGLPVSIPGYVPLGRLASTCRGIATGANSFFHLSLAQARLLRLHDRHLKPCIGRARDVVGYSFSSGDFARLEKSDASTRLFTVAGELSGAERAYLAQGESDGLPERYLLSQRSPWYTMERREPAPIWAAVFGRRELRFVHNESGILNLTTFHAIYPRNRETNFVKALTACLNSTLVQEASRLQHRVYGGGLLKFEPKDLLEIRVPDLRNVTTDTLDCLAGCLAELDQAVKADSGEERAAAHRLLNAAVTTAAEEAAQRALDETSRDQSVPGPLWAQHTHRDAPTA